MFQNSTVQIRDPLFDAFVAVKSEYEYCCYTLGLMKPESTYYIFICTINKAFNQNYQTLFYTIEKLKAYPYLLNIGLCQRQAACKAAERAYKQSSIPEIGAEEKSAQDKLNKILKNNNPAIRETTKAFQARKAMVALANILQALPEPVLKERRDFERLYQEVIKSRCALRFFMHDSAKQLSQLCAMHQSLHHNIENIIVAIKEKKLELSVQLPSLS